MTYSFLAWRVDLDGRWYANPYTKPTLAEAQSEHRRIVELLEGSDPSKVPMCGVGPLECPSGGPWPRPGDAGRDPVLVRAPEAAVADVA